MTAARNADADSYEWLLLRLMNFQKMTEYTGSLAMISTCEYCRSTIFYLRRVRYTLYKRITAFPQSNSYLRTLEKVVWPHPLWMCYWSVSSDRTLFYLSDRTTSADDLSCNVSEGQFLLPVLHTTQAPLRIKLQPEIQAVFLTLTSRSFKSSCAL
jgi:hypothetical protein